MEVGNHSKKGFNYLLGAANFVVAFCLVWLLWYVFLHPNGILKLYTPMYGFSLVAILLCSVILISKVLEFYPFPERIPTAPPSLGMGVVLTLTAFISTLVITYGVFWNFLGRYGVAYFSPESIVVSGGTGAEPFVALEIAGTAVIYFATAFLWWAFAWNAGFGKWPWTNTTRGVRAWSRLATILVLSIVSFVVLFHPHVCHLFYPAQNKAGVVPWWTSFAGTGSAFFCLGPLLCTLAWIVVSDLQWEGYPWKLMDDAHGGGTFLKGVVTMSVTSGLGVLLCAVLLKVMNVYWLEPFEGGQYTDAPYFRYLHSGEVANFVILSACVLHLYFNNFPNIGPKWVRLPLRTLMAAAGGGLFWLFYYSPAATLVLGKVPGIAQPDDTPLAWTMLFISVILIQEEFFGAWPLRVSLRREGDDG